MGLISKKRKSFGKMKGSSFSLCASRMNRVKPCIGKLHGKHWTAIMTCRECVVRLISVRRSHKDEVEACESD